MRIYTRPANYDFTSEKITQTSRRFGEDPLFFPTSTRSRTRCNRRFCPYLTRRYGKKSNAFLHPPSFFIDRTGPGQPIRSHYPMGGSGSPQTTTDVRVTTDHPSGARTLRQRTDRSQKKTTHTHARNLGGGAARARKRTRLPPAAAVDHHKPVKEEPSQLPPRRREISEHPVDDPDYTREID